MAYKFYRLDEEVPMQVQINYGDAPASSALSSHVRRQLDKAVRHVRHAITRVEVHIRNDKRKRRGADDARCVMEARLSGLDPLAVTHRASDLYEAVKQAAHKLGRAVTRRQARRQVSHGSFRGGFAH